jgi:phosphatidate cytidylyltransferase
MNMIGDAQVQFIVGGIFVLLSIASIIGWILPMYLSDQSKLEAMKNFNARVRAWWLMMTIFLIATCTGKVASLMLFGLVSFLALREFISLTPASRADRRTLFFVIMPVQYLLLAINWLALFLIFIPIYACLWIPIHTVMTGDSKDFFGRTAKIQWAVMVCVYFVSYAPALLYLRTPGYGYHEAKLLFFFVFVVQISDVMQYLFGKLIGKHKISPTISPNKTVEGFVGGVLSAILFGAGIYWMTPFSPWQAGLMAAVITLMGFAGGLVMSAVKRDYGVKDYGTLLPGHGGMMDRIDSLCFAAPVFYHLTRYFFAA